MLSDSVRPGNGPFGVYQSLIEGLRLLHVPFNGNPPISQVGDVVIVLSGVDNLRKAIGWKQANRISCLLGGPNIMNRPCDYNYLFTSKEVDACLVPSDWIRIAYEEDASMLKGRVSCWPAGVDIEEWKPAQKKDNSVVVYWKTGSEVLCQRVEGLLRKYKYVPIRVRYGSYNKATYKNILNKAKFAVFISRSESQGIALAEAWAMNVSTLAYDPGQLTYLGRRYSIVSSCPYLTEQTGKSWSNVQELETILKDFDSFAAQFNPRNWVVSHMSYEVSARKLINIIESI